MRLIDADALIEVIEKMANNEWNIQVGSSKGLEDAIDVINDTPTVEPTFGLFKEMLCSECEKRPQGKWEILKGDYFTGGGDPILICPFCHSEESKHIGGVEFPINWNFCPKCGADMREEEEHGTERQD